MERKEEQILRGEIYYVRPASVNVGSEQIAGRPAIVVSNDKANQYSPVVEMVYLTTQPKGSLPTHVDITSVERPSIALCEQIHSPYWRIYNKVHGYGNGDGGRRVMRKPWIGAPTDC